jgi:threonine dehydratase
MSACPSTTVPRLTAARPTPPRCTAVCCDLCVAAEAVGQAEPLPVSIDDVRIAAGAIQSGIARTPTAVSTTLSAITGAEIVVKFESFQFTASFKERGALNRLLALSDEERRRGVVAVSAGNHALAVAHHARRLGIDATIVMPESTPFVKIAGTRDLGATVELRGAGVDDAMAYAHELVDREGRSLVHPFDDPLVMAGQGTLALELLEDGPPLDALVLPIGGGGLISGCAVAMRAMAPDTEIIGVQTELFPSLCASSDSDTPRPRPGPTIAEGIAVKAPGALTRRCIDRLVDDVVSVPEATIEQAVNLYLEIEKVVSEGAGAVGLAAVLAEPERFRGRRVGLVVTGANIDPRLLASIIMRGLVRHGRLTRLDLDVDDRPGVLAEITGMVGASGANIVEVAHARLSSDLSVRSARIDLLVETEDRGHVDRLIAALEANGHRVTVVEA